MITGDFNLPGIFRENTDLRANLSGLKINKPEVLEELIMFLQLFQYNFSQNFCFNTLDLISSNSDALTVSKTLFSLINIDIVHPNRLKL